MTIIKKIILIISVILFAIPTYAVDMCASENAIVFVLDPNISHTSGGASHDVPTSTWRVKFPYGTIIGISACLGNYDSNQANNGTVFGGEQTGRYCFCKMTHPAVSKWVYYGSVGDSGATCNNNCVSSCKNWISSGSSADVERRKTFFKTITN